MDTWFNTVKRLLKHQKKTYEDLADCLSVSKAAVGHYMTGRREPSLAQMKIIAKFLNVRLSELLGELEASVNFSISPDLKGRVPLISWVQAGAWSEVIDQLQPGEGEMVETTYQAKTHTYALRVRGDSMEPRFPDGSILIIEPEEQPEPGKFVIVRQNGNTEATFKQLVSDGGALFLKPLNPRYPIMELLPDAVFCGVVKRVEMDV